VGGALLGTLSTFAVARFTSNANILKGLNALEERSRALFYSVGFTVLFCITTVFEDIRKIITRLAEAI
jgi:hypothetical protein